MILLIVEIEDTRSGTKEERVLGEWDTSFPVDIRQDATCKIQLVAPGVEALHVRYYARGHHRFLDVLADGAVVLAHGSEFRRGDYCRIDYQPFAVGPFRIRFDERVE